MTRDHMTCTKGTLVGYRRSNRGHSALREMASCFGDNGDTVNPRRGMGFNREWN